MTAAEIQARKVRYMRVVAQMEEELAELDAARERIRITIETLRALMGSEPPKAPTIPKAPKIPKNGPKNPHAQALGRLGGSKGGTERARRLSPERRTELARNAANVRWNGQT